MPECLDALYACAACGIDCLKERSAASLSLPRGKAYWSSREGFELLDGGPAHFLTPFHPRRDMNQLGTPNTAASAVTLNPNF